MGVGGRHPTGERVAQKFERINISFLHQTAEYLIQARFHPKCPFFQRAYQRPRRVRSHILPIQHFQPHIHKSARRQAAPARSLDGMAEQPRPVVGFTPPGQQALVEQGLPSIRIRRFEKNGEQVGMALKKVLQQEPVVVRGHDIRQRSRQKPFQMKGQVVRRQRGPRFPNKTLRRMGAQVKKEGAHAGTDKGHGFERPNKIRQTKLVHIGRHNGQYIHQRLMAEGIAPLRPYQHSGTQQTPGQIGGQLSPTFRQAQTTQIHHDAGHAAKFGARLVAQRGVVHNQGAHIRFGQFLLGHGPGAAARAQDVHIHGQHARRTQKNFLGVRHIRRVHALFLQKRNDVRLEIQRAHRDGRLPFDGGQAAVVAHVKGATGRHRGHIRQP